MALLERICALLGEHGLAFAGVLHRPDRDGDQRNHHAHIAVSLRPCRARGDGSFDLAASTAADLNDGSFIGAFRAHVAKEMNAAMEAAGHARRFTAQSRAARGLAPVTARQAKATPGQKHHERRVEGIKKAQAELSWLRELRAINDRVMSLLGTVQRWSEGGRARRLASLRGREATWSLPQDRGARVPDIVRDALAAERVARAQLPVQHQPATEPPPARPDKASVAATLQHELQRRIVALRDDGWRQLRRDGFEVERTGASYTINLAGLSHEQREALTRADFAGEWQRRLAELFAQQEALRRRRRKEEQDTAPSSTVVAPSSTDVDEEAEALRRLYEQRQHGRTRGD
ncbi:hypothetical protein FHY05_000676 [Sphingomonas sp. BK580]|nr:hypothetical protein [Sphingomonas sp. BK580]